MSDASHALIKYADALTLEREGQLIVGNAIDHAGWPVRVLAAKNTAGDWDIVIDHRQEERLSRGAIRLSRAEASLLTALVFRAQTAISEVEAKAR